LKSSGDGISLLNNLIADIHSKQVAKRALFSNLPFEIGPGFNISVKGYNILSKQRPALSCFIWLEGEKAQVAVGMTEKTSETSAAPLEKDQIKKAYKMGGDTVLFTPEEQKELKNFGPPGLRIIGFKPQSQLPFWASMNKSTFIYPSEDDYVGSTRVFTALWQKLLKDEKMGIAWYIARKNASPMLVAVLPSAERLDEATNVQVIPAGLWLHPLPYADDIRHIPEVPKPLVSPDELTDRMNFVVRQLQLPKAIYDPLKYPNPALQWHYRILQAIALEEELPDIPEDKTIPKYRQIEKRAGEYIYNWGVTLDEKFTAHEKERRGKHLLEDADEAPKKKAKAANGLETMSSDDVKKAARAGTLGGFTVPDIKRWLLSKGLSSSGKKADLVERIEQWVEDSK
jgi:ATP-dependent DNA helicase 2 subunit 1